MLVVVSVLCLKLFHRKAQIYYLNGKYYKEALSQIYSIIDELEKAKIEVPAVNCIVKIFTPIKRYNRSG